MTRRRSQKDRFPWERMKKLANDFLPQPKILHPWPSVRFAVIRRKLLVGVTAAATSAASSAVPVATVELTPNEAMCWRDRAEKEAFAWAWGSASSSAQLTPHDDADKTDPVLNANRAILSFWNERCPRYLQRRPQPGRPPLSDR